MKLKAMKNILIGILFLSQTACGQQGTVDEEVPVNAVYDTLTVGAGCFWCVEAPFEHLHGVTDVQAGYAGGTVANPSYELVCTGTTGHAEAVRVVYDTNRVSYATLLEVFFGVHDPTQLNRQGADFGTQYRSVIFYRNESERLLASKIIEELDASGAFSDKIVTKLEPMGPFYAAENYHQDYFVNNAEAPYCKFVIQPKMDKFQMVFQKYLKQ
jgi:methionine-S-sulfoxide reductase